MTQSVGDVLNLMYPAGSTKAPSFVVSMGDERAGGVDVEGLPGRSTPSRQGCTEGARGVDQSPNAAASSATSTHTSQSAAKAGSYPYLCTVPGHAAAVMKGLLRVA